MQLKQRVKKERSGRRTVKRLHVQKGGENWVVIDDEARRNEWATAFAADPSWAGMYDTLVSNPRPEPTTDDGKEKAVTQYVNAVMRQDELFDMAIRIIRKSLGIADNEPDILTKVASIEGRKKEMLEYLKDVHRIVSFNVMNNAGTKFNSIETDASESLASLLLYPARASNIFIQAISTIAVQLKNDANAPLKQTVTDNPIIKRIQADHFKAYADSLAFLKTARQLRDGFFIGQEIDPFRKILASSRDASSVEGDFWEKFVGKLRDLIKAPDNAQIESILGNPGTYVDINIPTIPKGTKSYSSISESWANITAAVVASYVKSVGNWDAIEFVKSFKRTPPAAEITNNMLKVFNNPVGGINVSRYIPNYTMLNSKIFGEEGLTLRRLYKQFNSYVVNYMLELAYMIQKMEPSVKAAVASTP